VLLSIEEYRRLAGGGRSLLDAIADDSEGGDFDFDPPELEGPIGRPADLG
jgi:hypothetical protein